MRNVDIGGTSECILDVLQMKPGGQMGMSRDVQGVDSEWKCRRMLGLV